MEVDSIIQQYFDAWNSRDPGAIVACFAEGGTYCDPVSGKVSGQTLVDYVGGLFTGFPDLSFEIVRHGKLDDHTVTAEWVMRGSNTGAFLGLPPSGKSICTSGADFIVVENGLIRSLTGYFDSRAVPEQLGLQVIVQPHVVGPVNFGRSVAMQGGKPRIPGAFSITSLQVRSAEESATTVEYGRKILKDMAQMDGFIGTFMGGAGRRHYTVSAWENPEQPRQIYRSSVHNEIMERFYNGDFSEGGAFGVWVPVHHTLLVRCQKCRKACDFQKSQGLCSCGAVLPEPPHYW